MKFIPAIIMFLSSSFAAAQGSLFQDDQYSLELMTGNKVLDWPENSTGDAKASTHQLTAYYYPVNFFAAGLSARYSIFSADTLSNRYEDMRGSDLSIDILFETPAFRMKSYGITAFAKAGVVVASEHVARTRTQNDEERYNLTGANDDVTYNLRFKNKAYRTSIGAKLLAYDLIDSTVLGFVLEAAQGKEKWTQRRYYYEGEQFNLERSDDPLAFGEVLLGFHILQ